MIIGFEKVYFNPKCPDGGGYVLHVPVNLQTAHLHIFRCRILVVLVILVMALPEHIN